MNRIIVCFLSVIASVGPQAHAADSSEKQAHHKHTLSVVKGANTVTAQQSGSWFDASTWSSSTVPDGSQDVLIPAGIDVTYDAVSDIRLDHVQVNGVLRFSRSHSSRMVVDTLIVDSDGELHIGSAGHPVPSSVHVEILIADNGNIDIQEDPSLLSRGVVASGAVRIHGSRKTTHLKVADDPRIGDTSLTLSEQPENWQVGDVLVLTGTRYSGWRWDNDIRAVRYFGTEDEVITITAVNGPDVSFTPALSFNHTTPRADLKASVANFSRNVSFATLNPEAVETHQRGHVMFMHNDNIDVRYAAFWDLGRTDKSFESLEVADFDTVTYDSNVRGRYSFHIHRAGVETPRSPAIVIGNAVMNSPGWGYVHHDSNAIFHNNASFNTFGAGFVAETGNEIGTWTRNIAIKAEGNSAFNPKNGNDVELFDMGRTGDGFWFQGRMVKSVGNIAASVNHGFVYLHRGSGMLGFDNAIFALPEALRLEGNVGPDDAPILNFHSNESYASTVGLYVVKANPNQQHDIHSHLSHFVAWEVEAGAALEYTSHYLLEDFDLIGKTPEPFSSAQFGIDFGTNTTDMVVNRAHIVGFDVGVGLGKDFTNEHPPSVNQYALIDMTYVDVNTDVADYEPSIDLLLTSADLNPGTFDVALDNLPLEYLSPATSAGSGVSYTGIKTDTVGPTPIPAGTDAIGTPSYDMIALCEQDGYYRTADGDAYAVVEEYFTDRATGEIHKFGLKTRLGPEVDDLLGNPFHAWRNAFQRGVIDLDSSPPQTTDDVAQTFVDTPVRINVLSNDSDPEDDTLLLDGIVQPNFGQAFANADGTIEYRPDYDFVGVDTLRYWASDDNGNFTPATVTIAVGPGVISPIFVDGFE